MKKIIFITVNLCLFTLVSIAQPQAREEKIEAMRVAFITNHLELTPEESQVFWPVYNEFQQEKKDLRQAYKQNKHIGDISEEEAAHIIRQNLEMEEKQIALKRRYSERLMGIVSAKKVVKLYQVEKEFKKQILNQIRKKKAGGRDRFGG